VRMRLLFVLCILMISFSSASHTAVVALDEEQGPHTVRNMTTSGYVEEVPYVWQQINGYCFPSALSMALQSMGIEMDLATLFAVTGAGFSAVYVNVEDMWAFFPGVMSRQAQWFESFAELHGLESAIYLDSDTDYGLTAAQAVAGMGQEFIDYHMQNVTPIDLVRSTIDAGYPLVIVVDTFYLPHEDWDIVRDMGITLQTGGVGHAIAIVGYDDLTRRVQVYDPGIGLNADDYGYPVDGSYNYSMAYSTLDVTWRSAGYVTFYVAPGSGPPEDYQERLAKYVTDRLLGNRTSYFRGYENFFSMSAGGDAFNGLALDMTPATIESYVRRVPQQYWQQVLVLLGTNLEAFLTMQYYSYRSALARLPGLLLDYNLTEFVGIAAQALPQMEALTSNMSVRASAEIAQRDSLFFETFYNISESYGQSLDLTSALREHSDSLDEIAEHCRTSARIWAKAGNILLGLVDAPTGLAIEQALTTIAGGGLVVVVCLALWRRKRSSRQS
jgi:hypothetical protein